MEIQKKVDNLHTLLLKMLTKEPVHNNNKVIQNLEINYRDKPPIVIQHGEIHVTSEISQCLGLIREIEREIIMSEKSRDIDTIIDELVNAAYPHYTYLELEKKLVIGLIDKALNNCRNKRTAAIAIGMRPDTLRSFMYRNKDELGLISCNRQDSEENGV